MHALLYYNSEWSNEKPVLNTLLTKTRYGVIYDFSFFSSG